MIFSVFTDQHHCFQKRTPHVEFDAKRQKKTENQHLNIQLHLIFFSVMMWSGTYMGGDFHSACYFNIITLSQTRFQLHQAWLRQSELCSASVWMWLEVCDLKNTTCWITSDSNLYFAPVRLISSKKWIISAQSAQCPQEPLTWESTVQTDSQRALIAPLMQ